MCTIGVARPSGPLGPLTGVLRKLPETSLPTFERGRRRFSVPGGAGYFVCLRRGPAHNDGRCFWYFRTGADVSPLQGRSFSGVYPQGRRRTGYVFIRNKEQIFKRSTEQIFKGSHALLNQYGWRSAGITAVTLWKVPLQLSVGK